MPGFLKVYKLSMEDVGEKAAFTIPHGDAKKSGGIGHLFSDLAIN